MESQAKFWGVALQKETIVLFSTPSTQEQQLIDPTHKAPLADLYRHQNPQCRVGRRSPQAEFGTVGVISPDGAAEEVHVASGSSATR
jgi:hypothetical protein